ncbi:MAG TPA: DUF6587 family protein [Caldimonas sp.]|nr:DUF6587 family protein [Caldimonas sp.]
MSMHITAQSLVVALVVAASATYATWALIPASLRRGLAGVLLRLPLPAALAARMRAVATSTSSCGCSGCDRNPLARADADSEFAATKPITLHRRLPG